MSSIPQPHKSLALVPGRLRRLVTALEVAAWFDEAAEAAWFCEGAAAGGCEVYIVYVIAVRKVITKLLLILLI